MDKAYDSEPAKRVLKSELHNKMFPEVSETGIETDEKELNKQRRKHEENIYSENKKILKLVDHLGLNEQWDDLKKAEKNREYFQSFAHFLKDKKTSVKKEMRSMDMEFGYSAYQEQSNIVHGSTAKFFVYADENQVVPIYSRSDEHIEDRAVVIANSSNWIAVMLIAIAQHSNWESDVDK